MTEIRPTFEGQLASFNTFFDLTPQAQKIALDLLDKASTERSSYPSSFTLVAEQEASSNRWKDYKGGLGDELAKAIDKTYWSGHGGNKDETVTQRGKFIDMLGNHDANSLQEAKSRLQEMLIN